MSAPASRNAVPMRFVAPLLILPVLPFALYTGHLCGCAHPMEVLTGMYPLKRTDAELQERLSQRIGPGRTRAEVDKLMGDTIGSQFERYCRRSGETADISCRAALQRDWFGYRVQGLSIEVAFDATGKVSRLDASRYSKWDWE